MFTVVLWKTVNEEVCNITSDQRMQMKTQWDNITHIKHLELKTLSIKSVENGMEQLEISCCVLLLEVEKTETAMETQYFFKLNTHLPHACS